MYFNKQYVCPPPSPSPSLLEKVPVRKARTRIHGLGPDMLFPHHSWGEIRGKLSEVIKHPYFKFINIRKKKRKI